MNCRKFGIMIQRTMDEEYIVIAKKSNGEPIPEDEPVFILRGRDHLALRLLDFYRNLCYADNCTDYHMDLLNKTIRDFINFGQNNPDKMKQPGITKGK